LSLADARELAAAAINKVAKGLDPAAEKQETKQVRREVEADTFEALATEYMRRVGDKLRSAHAFHLTLQRAVYPTIGARPVTEIRRREIVALLDKIEDERGPVASDRVVQRIDRAMACADAGATARG
jgi:hypothetical protein